jgi:hypothetical protein
MTPGVVLGCSGQGFRGEMMCYCDSTNNIHATDRKAANAFDCATYWRDIAMKQCIFGFYEQINHKHESSFDGRRDESDRSNVRFSIVIELHERGLFVVLSA